MKQWLGLLCFFTSAISQATQSRPVSLREMAQSSDLIFQGVVLDVKSEWEQKRQRLVTFTTFSVSQIFKGPNRTQVVLWQVGGKLDTMQQDIPGAAVFKKSEEVILFTKQHKDVWVMWGLGHGKFIIERPAETVPTVRHDSGWGSSGPFVEQRSWGPTVSQGLQNEPLETFIARLQTTLVP